MKDIPKNNKISDIISRVLFDMEFNMKLVNTFENELINLPKGNLCPKKINGKVYLYHYLRLKDEKNTLVQRCLSKKNSDTAYASDIKRRHFIQKSLPYLYNNIKVVEAFIKKYTPYDATEIESKLPKSYDGISHKSYHDISEKPSLLAWLDEPYKVNELYPECLINSTPCGRIVRSKSESIIASMLENNNIPYRYEAELKIGESTYYPDFTILKPKDGEIIYWEHFGMIKNTEYSLSMEHKLISYIRYGILPWDKVIITYDSKNGSIDAQNIQNIIKLFIL